MIRLRRLRYLLPVCLIFTTGWSQTTGSGRAANSAQRIPSAKQSATKAKTGGGKVTTPDPDLFDGSIYEPEKRPLHGMVSEIEMGENESSQKQEKVSPQSGDPGGAGSPPPPELAQGGGAQKAEAKSDGSGKVPEGPEAKPEGVKVANLQVPEGAQAQSDGSNAKPRDLQIGDATLQIQTVPQNNPNVVGAQSTSTQQYEKKVPQGQQTDNRNRGVERGKEMPKGL